MLTQDQNIYLECKAWPFQEAAKIYKAIGGKIPEKGYVILETGYGPSGLPHIGTFGEVARTTMVMHAFKKIAPHIPVKIIAFSDDMDGLRKVPDNVPNKDMLKTFLHKPLTSIPDPFGTHESYAHNMNARLCAFLDQFDFEYEFKSATECYKSGLFNDALIKILENYDKIMKIMLPTLGEERQATYSPILPVCPDTGDVLQVALKSYDIKSGTITFINNLGNEHTISVKNGNCKLQWKPDWGMRWAALDVNFEMHGKDLTPSAVLSKQICQVIGGKGPILYTYELFLDQNGQKISKSKGNGLSMDEWLTYAPTESLQNYMYQSPTSAKKLYFDIIPKQVDEYLQNLNAYYTQDERKRLNNPVYHIHNGNPPEMEVQGINFSLLLNLVGVCNPDNKDVLWKYINKYAPQANSKNSPFLDKLAEYAMKYYEDFIKNNKDYKILSEEEKNILTKLADVISSTDINTQADDWQTIIFTIGKDNGYSELREWFKLLYQALLGQEQGPRLGTFIVLCGKEEILKLINHAINRS